MSNPRIMEWAKGHEGAMIFLRKLDKLEPYEAERITDPLLCMNSIRGKRLFNLWVLADRNMEKVEKLVETVPYQLLEGACALDNPEEAKKRILKMT